MVIILPLTCCVQCNPAGFRAKNIPANIPGVTTAVINNSLSDPSLDLGCCAPGSPKHMLRPPLSPPQGESGGFDSQVCPRMVGSAKALKCLQNVL